MHARFLIYSLCVGITAVVFLFDPAQLSRTRSQVLPINSFTTADGLAQNNITRIFQDSKGYLWIGTGEGLNRFDGYSFKTYDTDDGLAASYVNDVNMDREGRLWVAINDGGIARLLDSSSERLEVGARKFKSFSISEISRAKNVNRIVFDSGNRLWCATEAGVFRARSDEVGDGDFEFVGPSDVPSPSREALVDRQGILWFGFRDRVMKVENDKVEYFDLAAGGGEFVTGITQHANGRTLVSTTSALYEFSDSQFREVSLSRKKDQLIETIHASRNGELWIGTNAGLIKRNEGRQQFITTENGLKSNAIASIYTDSEGTIWFGTSGGGLNNLASRAIVTFVDPLFAKPQRVTEANGKIYVQAGCHPDPIRLVAVSDNGVEPVNLPPVRMEGCRRNSFLQSSARRFWMMSEGVLSVFDESGRSGRIAVELPGGEPVAKYTEIYEDALGMIWLSAADRHLYVADGKERLPRFEIAAKDIGASMIMRDSRGTLWLANNVFLGRYREGSVNEIKNSGVNPKIGPRSLFEDGTGRVWIGTRFNGVLYTDDPDSSAPTFRSITTSDGLTSNSIWAITADNIGGIYFGTGRGVVRYEPATGVLRAFTAADGMSESIVNFLFRDSGGNVWVASEGSVSRIDPSALDQESQPPPIFISQVVVEGAPLNLDETGVAEFATADLGSDENSVTIQFVGLDLKGERSLSYQYKLEGVDHDWSPAGKQREVNLVNLGPGSYRFLVKAINRRGIESLRPAVIQFRILAPFWQRWWFISLAVMAIGAILYALYRYRMARVIELERVRTRIATDLHDDIGANLTRIALMSEVLNQQGPNGSAAKMLPSIANIARESVASMNDIVWAISPDHDRVLDLTRRMRQHAEEVFTIRDIDVDFVSNATDSELKLPVGVRRDVLLIFKEAVNNAARHSGCTCVRIEFESTTSRLRLQIEDNGRGFETGGDPDGHGLSSMKRRGASLGGIFEIETRVGTGTTVRFEMPLH